MAISKANPSKMSLSQIEKEFFQLSNDWSPTTIALWQPMLDRMQGLRAEVFKRRSAKCIGLFESMTGLCDRALFELDLANDIRKIIIRQCLKENFPWLGTDEDVNGADLVDQLTTIYEDLEG